MASRTIERLVHPTNPNGKITRLIGSLDIDGNGTDHPLADVDPFILLDAGVITKNAMPPFGAHPHRGHSVVTILMSGSVQSWDSFRTRKESETLTAPASYWVDAGNGVFHDERSVIPDESDESQHMRIFQLWVGVKDEDRKKPPRIQTDSNLPKFELKDSEDKVVGSGIYYVGEQTTIETPHPISVAQIKQNKGTTYRHPIDPSHGAFVIHVNGKPSIGGTTPEQVNDVLVLKDGDDQPEYLEIKASDDEDAEYMVCSGEKHKEKWYKKLMANGAVIAASEEEARGFEEKVVSMSKAGKAEGGSFSPWGM